MDGCVQIGHGAKGDVYRYDDELVIKVYNQNNTYHDVEQEIALSRRAFILGIPTAISFGIVSVGSRYGAMYELVESDTFSQCIARSPGQVETYASMMAELAHSIHDIEVSEQDGFPDVRDRLRAYIRSGIAYEDEVLSNKCLKLIDTLPPSDHLVHGDFHTNNVFLQKGEPLLIDMDRLSTGHPIAEIGDLYYFYVVLVEDDPSVVEKFMGFSYETAKQFFHVFLKRYHGTEDEEKLREVIEKASFLCYTRMVRKLRKSGQISEPDRIRIDHYLEKTAKMAAKLDTLVF